MRRGIAFAGLALLLVIGGILAFTSPPRLLSAYDWAMGGGAGARQVAKAVPFGNHGQTLDIWAPDTAVKNKLPVAIFWYGGGWAKGDRAAYAFAGRALGVPAIIHFSTLTAHKKWAEARRLMGQALLIIGGIALGLTIIVWGFSDWLVAQLFERGAFTAVDTAHVAEVQKYYSLQLTFQFIGVLLVRMLSALGKNHVLFVVGIFNFFVNILLNWIFMKTLGVAGIALATSVVLFISSLLCGAMVWRSLNAEFPGKRSV